jgi:hypothetical protein
MRTLIAIIFSLLASTAFAQSPTLQERKATVQLKDISLQEAFTILTISYGVTFSYSDDIVDTKTMVHLDIRNEVLSSALQNLLQPLGLTYKVLKANHIVVRKTPANLTQTIRGSVIDLVTSRPIPGATIIVPDSNPLIGTTSDESGKFKIEGAAIGRTTLVITSIGYDTRKLNNLLVGTGKEIVLDVALSESITKMNEVVVTALKNDGIPAEGVAVTSGKTFSVEDTKRFAGSMGDPARMASAFAGVTIGSDENNSLVVRGNSPRGVLWKVEGIEIPNPNHFTSEGASGGVVSVLSPNIISNFDFLTGAFPAQHGNALSAVFDISLREGNNEKREYSVQTGFSGLEASAEGPFSKRGPASYLINYRYSTLSVLDRFGFDLNETGQYKDYQDVSFKINCPTKRAGIFSLFGIGGKSEAVKSDTTVLDNNLSDMGVMGLTYKHMIKENTFLQGSVSFSGTRISKISEVNGFSSGTFATEASYSKTYLRALLSARRRITNRFFVEGGATISQLNYNFFLKTINPENTSYPVVINFSEQEQGHTYITQGFLYARQYFSPTLFGFYGLHFIRFGLTKDYSIEPRAGFRWEFSPSQSISVAYGKHGRIENLQYYLARDHQAGGNDVQINKDLGFTKANHFVVSYNHALSSQHALKIETYYQQLYNAPVQTDPTSIYSTLNEDTGFITDSLINNGRGKNYGVEFSIEKSFSGNFYYLVNAAVFRSGFTIDGQRERSTAYDANYNIHFLAGKEFQTGWRANRLGVNIKITGAGGRQYVPIDLQKSIQEQRQVHKWEEAFEHQLPDYFRADFQAVYKINRLRYSFEWRLDIQNITNHRNPGWYYYDVKTQSIKLKNQLGIIPLLSCRVEF